MINTFFNFLFLNWFLNQSFLSNKDIYFSCSFIFTFKDKYNRPHYYTVTQQPVFSLSGDRNLLLVKNQNQEFHFSIDQIINLADIQKIYLVNRGTESIGRLRFVCKGWSEGTHFPSDDFTKPVFLHLLSIPDEKLPTGIKICRIVSEKEGRINGITQIFKLDFSSLKEKKTHLINTPDLKYKIFFRGSMGLTRKSGQLGQREKENKNYYSPHLFSVFRFMNLPEDFYSKKYAPIQIETKTICSGPIFPNKNFEKIYSFFLLRMNFP